MDTDTTQEILELQEKAKNGDAVAQSVIGCFYREGEHGFPKNGALAAEWYRKAAEQGFVHAQWDLGYLYEKGQGVKEDKAEAAAWYRKAAEQGDSMAQNRLGEMYRDGQGVEQDYAQAMAWFKKAAKTGNPNPLLNMGMMYEDGIGVQQDYSAAEQCYMESARYNATANYRLSLMYENGKSVKKAAESTRYLIRAAELGNTEAEYKLGVMYLQQNASLAATWLRRAATSNHPDALYLLGTLYEEGRGVRKDRFNAENYYYEAAELGHAEAQRKVDLMQEVNDTYGYTKPELRGDTLSGASQNGKPGKPEASEKSPVFIVLLRFLPELACIILLLLALLAMPYGYYHFLKLAVCSWAILAFRKNKSALFRLLYAATTLLYNPIIPVHLTRSIWSYINVATVVLVLASIVWECKKALSSQKQDETP